MKSKFHVFLVLICTVLVLVSTVFIAGCSSNASPSQKAPAGSGVTVQTSPVLTAVPTSAVSTPIPTTVIPKVTATLSNGMLISYPANWDKKEPMETSLREYGRTTTNIANFFSPETGVYTTVSIDVDPLYVSEADDEQYFNLATVSIQKSLGSIDITHTQQTGAAYKGPSECADCKAVFNLEFESKEGKRWYQFINNDGHFIIITIKNPELNNHKENKDLLDMLASIKIPPKSIEKQR